MAPKKPTPTYNEIASIQDGRDITRGYLGPLLQYQDKILTMRGGSDLAIYEEIDRDEKVYACRKQRQDKLTSWPWEVVPGRRKFQDVSKADEKAADFIREMLDPEHGIGFDRITQGMSYGFGNGYAVAECLYVKDGQYVTWDDTNYGIKIKKAKRFRVDPEGNLRLITYADMWQGEALDPYKFWHFCSGADNDDDPYGLGYYHFCYWPVTIKREGMVAWTQFLKRFAMPFILGKYPTGTTADEQNKLKAMIRAIASGSGGTAPEGILIELIEASRSGTADYSQIIGMMDSAIAKVILGETMTIDAEGGQYKGGTHADVQEAMVQSDSDALCSSFTRGPVRWLVEYNRGMLGDAVPPAVWRRSPDYSDEAVKADIYEKLWNIGYEPVDIAQVNTVFGGEWQKRQVQPAPTVVPDAKQSAKVAEFAEPASTPSFADQAALDAAIDGFSPEELQGGLESLLRPMFEFIESASLEEIQERIAEVYPNLDTAEFEEKVARAIFVGEVWGRLNAGNS
jgi:phage gp29-like protein